MAAAALGGVGFGVCGITRAVDAVVVTATTTAVGGFFVPTVGTQVVGTVTAAADVVDGRRCAPPEL